MTRWRQPTAQRDAHVKKERAPTAQPALSDGAPVDVFGDLESETPPPVDVSPLTAYNHATNVQRRTANALAQIAHSSGVGMLIADEVQSVKDVAHEGRRLARENDKKLRRWQALALSAVVASGGSIVGVAKGLYSRGEQEGANEQIIQQLTLEVERDRAQIDKMRDQISEIPRFPRIWDNPQKDK